MPYYKKK